MFLRIAAKMVLKTTGYAHNMRRRQICLAEHTLCWRDGLAGVRYAAAKRQSRSVLPMGAWERLQAPERSREGQRLS
jgi:hypothetical protein